MERFNWFKERVGKRVFRNKTSCSCGVCALVYENGLIINDEMHADYLFEMEYSYTSDGFPLKYFDTIEESRQFEDSLPKS